MLSWAYEPGSNSCSGAWLLKFEFEGFTIFVKIEKLHYLNLEVNAGKTVNNAGKTVNTKENINIRCRINSSEEHTWYTSHGQINLIVDSIHNFLYILG